MSKKRIGTTNGFYDASQVQSIVLPFQNIEKSSQFSFTKLAKKIVPITVISLTSLLLFNTIKTYIENRPQPYQSPPIIRQKIVIPQDIQTEINRKNAIPLIELENAYSKQLFGGKTSLNQSSLDIPLGDLERELFIKEHQTDVIEPEFQQEDLKEYYKQFLDSTIVKDWQIEHAKKVYLKHTNFLNKTTHIYNVPLDFFLGKLGTEGGEMTGKRSFSITGAQGYSQLFDGAVEAGLKYVGRENIKEGLLYKEYLAYKKSKTSKQKQTILNRIKSHPQKNLEAGIAYSAYLHDIFCDWSLASAAYQIGPGKMAKFLHYHKGITTKQWLPAIYKVKRDPKTQKLISIIFRETLKTYVTQNQININSLLQNKSFMKYYTNKFKGPHDELKTYSLKVLNCAYKINEELLFHQKEI